MNKIVTIIGLLFLLMSCEDSLKTEEIQKPFEKTPEYYANLKAYKSLDRQIAFGWFGGWTASGPSMSTRLMGAPDSMDIITIWGNQWVKDKMTPEKYEDLRLVRDIKGTKVCVTILLGWTGKDLDPNIKWPEDRREALVAYAKALADDIIGRGFDGFDIDYEPTVGGGQDVKDCPRGEDMEVFVKELGKYFGPKSGSGKLLIIDGEISTMIEETEGLGEYFDYAVAQAYYSYSPSGLQSRYDAVASEFPPNKFIVTEDFESGWKKGGWDFSDPKHGTIPSLLGMAYWSPRQGKKGGAGSYHMEYEYNHPDIDYKYLRQAIQIMNPAVK